MNQITGFDKTAEYRYHHPETGIGHGETVGFSISQHARRLSSPSLRRDGLHLYLGG